MAASNVDSLSRYYTVEEAVEFIISLGISVSKRQVRRWAEKKKLPFFPHEGRNYIKGEAIVSHFNWLQSEATKAARRFRKKPEAKGASDDGSAGGRSQTEDPETEGEQ